MKLGYIDLSKRKVKGEEISKCEEMYKKAKTVHSILRQAAINCNTTLLALYECIGWPLYKKYGHALDAFKIAIQ